MVRVVDKTEMVWNILLPANLAVSSHGSDKLRDLPRQTVDTIFDDVDSKIRNTVAMCQQPINKRIKHRTGLSGQSPQPQRG